MVCSLHRILYTDSGICETGIWRDIVLTAVLLGVGCDGKQRY